jgi:hypothetical protein
MKLHFPRRILEKYLNITFHRNTPSGTRVFPCGQTERERERERERQTDRRKYRYKEATSRFSQFYKRA